MAEPGNAKIEHRNIKKLIVTTGDPAGIGPEIALKAAEITLHEFKDLALILFGDKGYFDRYFPHADFEIINETAIADLARPGLYFVDFDNIELEHFELGQVNAMAGRAAGEYIEKAVKLLLKGQADGMVTAPINKEAFNLGGYKYPGHTEFLAELCEVDEPVMLMYSEDFSVALVTIHVALKDVPDLLDEDKEYKVIKSVVEFFRRAGVEPRIAVCGLNPHASEHSIFGQEEEKVIIPAIKRLKKEGAKVAGPFPSDTLFYYAAKGQYDVVIAQYHDQGLIPFKLLFFDRGVNVTVGLPIVRTSPDHGTAFDIAGKNIADPSSMVAAIKAAYKFSVK